MDSDSRPGRQTSADWRADLLAGITLRPAAAPAVNRLGWPDYDGRPALRWGAGPIAGVPAVAAVWDFAVHGGSFGEADAAGFAEAAAAAVASRRPLVSFLRSGGTRLQEGVAGLVGLPRAALALATLDAAGVGHVAIADQPTTGGVWVTIGSRCDLRCAVGGATVGFAGPRVVAATTGAPPPAGSHTAASAFAAGLVDAAPAPDGVTDWLHRALIALTPPSPIEPAARASPPRPPRPSRPLAPPVRTVRADLPAGFEKVAARSGWEQVVAARTGERADGATVLRALLPDGVDLVGPDSLVGARIGALLGAGTAPHGGGGTAPHGGGGIRAVVVAVGARRGSAPGPAGYRLLARAARLAGKLGVGLVTLVDTPGAAGGAHAESAGIAAAIGDAMAAVLACPSPTVSVVLGEGGSGGALAATVTDMVAMTPNSYFTALSPEGAATTLRIPVEQAADRAGLRPTDLHRLGFADCLLPATTSDQVAQAAAGLLAELSWQDPTQRREWRQQRWSTELRDSL
ncbi:Carboxyl transferase domain [Frankia torreyi]|uniref:acetyl-CoA carboxytransferase n=1 Tax=Frankia torreyi TaxID=1856 RepID=A0A0D8BJ78_9ACTN|nr:MULTISPECIES: carboxyl transferase domain-containing protein [Frankia]KJE24135.1 Carboxyl transferase domain [Frankia torreyi]KQM06052.1 acetyl-CoA carboxylase beta subunit [Frankia sp. CpI1-P]